MKRSGWLALGLVGVAVVIGLRVTRQQQLDRQLLEAVRRDAGEVNFLLQAGANPNVKESDGTTALLIAAATRKPEVVSLLAERGAHLNLADGSGRTALHRAAALGDDAVLQALTEHGATVDLPDRKNRTALMLAAAAGYPQAIRVLLDAGADPNRQDREGQTPLIVAAAAGLLQISTLLIQHGAEVNSADKLGQTALIRALQLPDRGSNPQSLSTSAVSQPSGAPIRRPGSGIPRGTDGTEAPVFSRDLVALLLKASVDVTVRDPQGRGVLDLAVGRLPQGMVAELRRRGARCNPDTDLLLAAALDRPGEAAAAIARGANVNGRDTAGRSALWWAICNRSVALAERLLEQGADPNGGAEPPLVRAIRSSDVKLVRLLFRFGARRRSGTGDSLLRLAVKTRNEELVRALLAAGVDPNEAASDGTTALHEAVSYGNSRMIQALIDGGADVHARLWERTAPRTILGRACGEGRSAIAAFLYQRGARLTGESERWIQQSLRTVAELRGEPHSVGGSPPVAFAGDPTRFLKSAELLERYLERPKP